MITEIHEAKYFDFAHALQAILNETYGEFLKNCETFFENHKEVSKNFATYIRSSHPSKNEYYFIIELDNRVLLDLTGIYNPKTNSLSDVSFRATLPQHETWQSEHFINISLTEQERQHFLSLQTDFLDFCQKVGACVITDILAFNPATDTFPESVVDITAREGSLNDWIHEEQFFSFLLAYYNYCMEVDFLFNEKWNARVK